MTLWMLGLNEKNKYLYPLNEFNYKNPRRQDLPDCYLANGAIYIASIRGFESFYDRQIIPFVMDEESSLDIDTEKDLAVVSEVLHKRM